MTATRPSEGSWSRRDELTVTIGARMRRALIWGQWVERKVGRGRGDSSALTRSNFWERAVWKWPMMGWSRRTLGFSSYSISREGIAMAIDGLKWEVPTREGEFNFMVRQLRQSLSFFLSSLLGLGFYY